MNASEIVKVLNKTVSITVEGFTIQVKVVDVKQAYGCTRYLVEPVNGSGQQWVNDSRVCPAA